MKILVTLSLIIISFSSIAQFKRKVKFDKDFRVIDTNIFRITIAQTGGSISKLGNDLLLTYEHEIKKPFTFLLNAGATLFYENIPVDASTNYRKSSYNLCANVSGEIRYYVTLKKRTQIERKIIKNYTGMFFGLQPLFISKSIVTFNQKPNYEDGPSFKLLLNTGWQRQYHHFYANIIFGVALAGSEYRLPLDWLHYSTALGYVF